jgi:hypothetical protein
LQLHGSSRGYPNCPDRRHREAVAVPNTADAVDAVDAAAVAVVAGLVPDASRVVDAAWPRRKPG